jgi:hypothetical protein
MKMLPATAFWHHTVIMMMAVLAVATGTAIAFLLLAEIAPCTAILAN